MSSIIIGTLADVGIMEPVSDGSVRSDDDGDESDDVGRILSAKAKAEKAISNEYDMLQKQALALAQKGNVLNERERKLEKGERELHQARCGAYEYLVSSGDLLS